MLKCICLLKAITLITDLSLLTEITNTKIGSDHDEMRAIGKK